MTIKNLSRKKQFQYHDNDKDDFDNTHTHHELKQGLNFKLVNGPKLKEKNTQNVHEIDR